MQEHTRQRILEARTLFETALSQYDADFRQFPLVIPEDETVRRRERDEAEQRYLQAKLDLAESLYYEAETFDRGSEQRNQVLESAVDGFQAIHNAHRSQIAGLIARLWLGRCFEEMDRIREALGIYNELLSHPGTSDTMQQPHSRSFLVAMSRHK